MKSQFLTLLIFINLLYGQESFLFQDSVSLREVFLVPRGENAPDQKHFETLSNQIVWCQETYNTLLKERDNFQIFKGDPLVFQGKYDMAYYKALPERGASQFTAEVLDYTGYNRFNSPFIFVVIVMNSRDEFPAGSGRPFNGGINTGGGVVIMSSYTLLNNPGFQSTLRHELGHSFGLPHVDVYGYDMGTNNSLMSYNTYHHTFGLKESTVAPEFIPEDLRALSLNKRVFNKLEFNAESDIPPGYKIFPRIIWLGPMYIPGQLAYHIIAETGKGETYNSSVSNVVGPEIKPGAGLNTYYDNNSMWHSGLLEDSLAEVDLSFPANILIDSIAVHSQHSGKYHPVKEVVVQVQQADGFISVGRSNLKYADDGIKFPAAEAKNWRLIFKSGKSRYVVVRGVRFFYGAAELFPPLIPYAE